MRWYFADGKSHPFEDLVPEGVHYREWAFGKSVMYVVHLRDVNGNLMPDRYFEDHDVSDSGTEGTWEEYLNVKS